MCADITHMSKKSMSLKLSLGTDTSSEMKSLRTAGSEKARSSTELHSVKSPWGQSAAHTDCKGITICSEQLARTTP